MRSSPAKLIPSEEEEQITLFEWAAAMTYTYPDLRWLYHVPNGGRRGSAEAGRFKAMGVRKGVPDVALDIPRGGFHGLRIEMKRREGGKLSDAQRQWIDHYNAIGYRAVVCHGWQEARMEIEDYLRGGGRMDKLEKVKEGLGYCHYPLEICVTRKCPYFERADHGDCVHRLHMDTLVVINELKGEQKNE